MRDATKDFLYVIIDIIAQVHSRILELNDAYEYNFTDKELHFLVIGVFGVVLLIIIYPIFKFLSKRGLVMAITWVYVFTFLIALTLAIEVGQKLTNTGKMEFDDIMFGVCGFIAISFVFLAICGIILLIRKLILLIIRQIKKKRG